MWRENKPDSHIRADVIGSISATAGDRSRKPSQAKQLLTITVTAALADPPTPICLVAEGVAIGASVQYSQRRTNAVAILS